MKKFRTVLLISALIAVLAVVGCSKSDHDYIPVPPGPAPDANVTGYWYVELGVEGGDIGPLTVTPMNGGEEEIFNLIVEFPIPEQDEEGVFSYTGPISIMGVKELYGTIEGHVDGNSVTATVTMDEWFTMTFTGTVTGNTVTFIWTKVEGEGFGIAVKGLTMKILVEEGIGGTGRVVISQTPHVPPRVAGAWEILEMTVDEGSTCELPNPLWEFPEDFVNVSQEGWVFDGYFDDEDFEFYGVVYLGGTVLLEGWNYYSHFQFAGTLTGDILTGTFEIEGECYATGSMTIKIHLMPYWHVISNTDAANTHNVFAWDRGLGEMPEEVAEALAAHPGAHDVWLPIYPEAGVDLGYLLPAAEGNHYAWFGSHATGTYEYFGYESAGSFMSGWITLPGTGPVPTCEPPPEPETNIFLDLDYWYEIESIDEYIYDEMFVAVLVQNEDGEWDFAEQFELTPMWETGTSHEKIGFSSPNGPDTTPEWTHATFPLNADLAGQTIRIMVFSMTKDGLFNEFRGHAIDNVTITVGDEVVFFDGFEDGSWRTGSGEWFFFEPDGMGVQSMGSKVPVDVLQRRSMHR